MRFLCARELAEKSARLENLAEKTSAVGCSKNANVRRQIKVAGTLIEF